MRDLRNISDDISSFDLLGKVTTYSFLSVLIMMIIFASVTSNRGKCLYAVWHNIFFLTLIHWIPLINIDDYSELESFFSQIAIIFRLYELPSVCLDESIENQVYKSIRIKSNSFINNAKEILLLYFTVLLFCIAILILSKFNNSEIIQKLKKQVKYSIIIRLHLLVYLDLMTFSMINVYFYTGQNACSSVNLGLSLFFLVMGGSWIMIIPVIIKVKMNNDLESHHDKLFESIETIVNEFKPSFQVSKYQYYTICLLYRFSIAFCLVVLPESPSVQLFIIVAFQAFICIIYLVFYILLAKPFAQMKDSITVFISEFFCLILAIIIGIRSLENISDNTKYYTSVLCIIIIWATEIVIIVRYVLKVVSVQKTSLETLANQIQIPVTMNHITETQGNNNEKKVEKSFEDLPESFINNLNSENNEVIETLEPYKYLKRDFADNLKRKLYKYFKRDFADNLNRTMIENSQVRNKKKPATNKVLPKIVIVNAPDVKFESRAMNSFAFDTNDYTVANRSKVNSILASDTHRNKKTINGQTDRHSNIALELKMNNFLEKVNSTKLQVGNKGLGI
ncbi:hypothetical protein SteCoe_11921 [Stentor coeruleus]|uniref:Uncharacterized protein n=1 Tax=Stentor coeruleus TaxID=5963 RepID=A0A1R2CC36_9CILI|nr:hypothetical protein SteCoe_11921 [Stentor coeruleus]